MILEIDTLTVEPNDIYNDIIDRNVKRFQKYKEKREIISDIAKEFEANGMKLPLISSEIKRRMREYYDDIEISDSWIDKTLEDKYKRPKKEKQKQTTPEIITTPIEENKPIEVSTTNEGNTFSEPSNYFTPEEEQNLEQQVGNKAGQYLDDINEQHKEIVKLREQNTSILQQFRASEDRVKNLENYINQRKNQKIYTADNFEYPDFPLAIDDKKVFRYNLPTYKFYASWLAEEIRKYIVQYPDNDYFLIQFTPTVENKGIMRLNIRKPEFTTNKG